jgi:predicted O-methyltransferase YrrM
MTNNMIINMLLSLKNVFSRRKHCEISFDSETSAETIQRYKLQTALKIFTHMTPQESAALFCTATMIPVNGLAVEIGSYLGSSANFICKGLSPGARLACIDTWENDAMHYDDTDIDSKRRDTYQEFILNTKAYKSQIIEIRKWSYDAIGDVKSIGRSIDFLFIDGDHNYDGVLKDWTLYSPLLARKSYVAFHDTGWAEGVQRVVKDWVAPIGKLHIALPNLQIYEIVNHRKQL